MLPQKVSSLARDWIEARLSPRPAPELCEAVRKRAAQLKSSSFTIGDRARDAAATEVGLAELERRSKVIFEGYCRALISVRPELPPTLEPELETAFEAHMTDEVIQIRGALRHPSVVNGPLCVNSFVDLKWSPLKRIVSEMKLFCERLRQQSIAMNQPNQVFNISGSIGALLTGPNASANVVQFNEQLAKDELLKALGELKTEVSKCKSIPAATEALEVFSDLESELAKERPNRIRFTSILVGLATTVCCIADLQPAYAMVKAAALKMGIQLP